MTDYPRYPYDRPDYQDSTLDPPFNKPIRHHKMGPWAEGFIWACAVMIIGGFVGSIALFISGVVE